MANLTAAPADRALCAWCAPGQCKALSRPSGDDPFRKNEKRLKGRPPWRNARVKLRPDEGYPQPSAPIKKHGFVQAG